MPVGAATPAGELLLGKGLPLPAVRASLLSRSLRAVALS